MRPEAPDRPTGREVDLVGDLRGGGRRAPGSRWPRRGSRTAPARRRRGGGGRARAHDAEDAGDEHGAAEARGGPMVGGRGSVEVLGGQRAGGLARRRLGALAGLAARRLGALAGRRRRCRRRSSPGGSAAGASSRPGWAGEGEAPSGGGSARRASSWRLARDLRQGPGAAGARARATPAAQARAGADSAMRPWVAAASASESWPSR